MGLFDKFLERVETLQGLDSFAKYILANPRDQVAWLAASDYARENGQETTADVIYAASVLPLTKRISDTSVKFDTGIHSIAYKLEMQSDCPLEVRKVGEILRQHIPWIDRWSKNFPHIEAELLTGSTANELTDFIRSSPRSYGGDPGFTATEISRTESFYCYFEAENQHPDPNQEEPEEHIDVSFSIPYRTLTIESFRNFEEYLHDIRKLLRDYFFTNWR